MRCVAVTSAVLQKACDVVAGPPKWVPHDHFVEQLEIVENQAHHSLLRMWLFLIHEIKWICPTAPQRPITLFGGFPSTAWFDVNDLSENAIDDEEGLDASAAYVASLLATEPPHIKLGVGGFSMGAATSLYSATCVVLGKYGNGNSYPVNLSAAVGLSGWLPCAKFDFKQSCLIFSKTFGMFFVDGYNSGRTLTSKLEGVEGAASHAASLPILLCHGKGDDVVPYKFGDKSSQKLRSCGFQDVAFKSYTALGHHTIPEEMDEVCAWLTSKCPLLEYISSNIIEARLDHELAQKKENDFYSINKPVNGIGHCLGKRLGEIDMFVKMQTICIWIERPYEASLFPGICFDLDVSSFLKK
ncbi:putative deSI-like protein-like [Capsicum annuum]|nr:putative deSI-like protein-like [Capsicum annuum]